MKRAAFSTIDENGNEFAVEGYISDVGFWNFVRMFRDPKISGPFFQVFGWTFAWAVLAFFFPSLLDWLLPSRSMTRDLRERRYIELCSLFHGRFPHSYLL